MATCGNDIHLLDIGTVFEITLKDCAELVDITTTTVRKLKFKKPDGTYVEKDAVIKDGDGTLGIVQYTTIADDLDQVGNWEVRAIITMPLGTWTSSKVKFKVMAVD